MRALRTLVLVALAAMAAACATTRPAAERPDGIEVTNHTRQHVKVYYYVLGSSTSTYLGKVGAGTRREFRFPAIATARVQVRTNDGRVVHAPHQISIRRVRP